MMTVTEKVVGSVLTGAGGVVGVGLSDAKKKGYSDDFPKRSW